MRRTCGRLARVTLLGAAGAVGQPLSLLLKHSPLVTRLHLYDTRSVFSLAEDIACVPAPADVRAFAADELHAALDAAEVVVVAASAGADLAANAPVVRDLAAACAEACPKALLCVLTGPVNGTVPIAAETLRKAGACDPRRLFGVTTLDVVRAKTLAARALAVSPYLLDLPVVGGCGGATAVPVFSAVRGAAPPPPALATQLAAHLREGDAEAEAVGLSAAYAAAEWVVSLLKAARGDPGVVEYAYVANGSAADGCEFFAGPVALGPGGVAETLPLPSMQPHEAELCAAAAAQLKEQQRQALALVS